MPDEAEEARRKAINERFLKELDTPEGQARIAEALRLHVRDRMRKLRESPLPPIDLHLDEQKKKEVKE